MIAEERTQQGTPKIKKAADREKIAHAIRILANRYGKHAEGIYMRIGPILKELDLPKK